MRSLLFIGILFLLSFSFVSASSEDYSISQVYVNGLDALNAKVGVSQGQILPVVVYLQGTGATKDVRVEAWIGGYAHGNIDAVSSLFTIENGISYRKTLGLSLPRDLVANKEYTLHVLVYDSKEKVENTYTLYVEGKNLTASARSFPAVEHSDLGSIVSVSSLPQLVAGEEGAFTVQVTNTASQAKSYTLFVDGIDASYRDKMIIPAGSTGSFTVQVQASTAGEGQLFVQVSQDNEIVSQKVLAVSVAEKSMYLWVVFGIVILFLILLILGFYFLVR
ncbi:hypothetical protein HZA98_02615 [Candidatus Woesearchaeota archaeon]|nr:hypothetical protein [Candidatus Woesearchaeota archaeon]